MNIFEIFLMVILFYAHLSTDLHRFFFLITYGIFRNFSDLCQPVFDELQRYSLIELMPDGQLTSLPFGGIMAKYFLSIATMITFQKVSQYILTKKIKATHLINAILFIIFIFSFVDMNQLMIFWQKLLIAPNFRSFIYEEMKRRL